MAQLALPSPRRPGHLGSSEDPARHVDGEGPGQLLRPLVLSSAVSGRKSHGLVLEVYAEEDVRERSSSDGGSLAYLSPVPDPAGASGAAGKYHGPAGAGSNNDPDTARQ